MSNDNVKDLWPSDLGPGGLVPPVVVLREQASFLGPKTHNIVEAEVSSGSNGANFVHTLYLVAPALDNYRYHLLSLTHGIELYPVNVTFIPRSHASQARNKDELLTELGKWFNDEKTVSVIRALIVQSET